MSFTEAKLEQTFIELLGHEGFSHHVGASLVGARKPDEVYVEIFEQAENFKKNQR